MQSKTLSSEIVGKNRPASKPSGWINGALLRKNLIRFWPLWAAYAAFWIIVMPVLQAVQLFGEEARQKSANHAVLAAAAASMLLENSRILCMVVAVVAGCLFAMALFSYLYSARSVGMMHAFPICREGLFLTNYFSGVTVFLTTDVAVVLLTAAVHAGAGVLNWKNLMIFFWCNAGEMLFFYSFAVFCAMFTGQILALPVFYAILNGLAAGVNMLLQSFAGAFLYGYQVSSPFWIKWLTPAWKLTELSARYPGGEQVHSPTGLENLHIVTVYAICGVIFAVLALLVYKTRRSETAGDTVSVRCMRPIFLWGVALCSAFSLGQGIYYLLRDHSGETQANFVPMMICIVLCGLVGYFSAKMLLKKSFRVFRGSWRGAAALVAIVLLIGWGTSADILKIAGRIPAASEVRSLQFQIGGENFSTGSTKDSALIQKFTMVQKAVISEKNLMRQRAEVYNRENREGGSVEYNSAQFSLYYTLKDGTVKRWNYSIFYKSSDVTSSGGNAISKLAALVRSPKMQEASLLNPLQMHKVQNGEMEYLVNGENKAVPFDQDAAERIYQAIRADVEAGNFGRNQFNRAKWEEETYVNTLTLYYAEKGGDLRGISVSFSKNCTATIAALKQAGVADAEHPLQAMSAVQTNEKD